MYSSLAAGRAAYYLNLFFSSLLLRVTSRDMSRDSIKLLVIFLKTWQIFWYSRRHWVIAQSLDSLT